MNRYTIYCTEEQTKKALELGAPVETQEYISNIKGCELPKDWFADRNICYHKPTAEQMIGWLEEQGISISIEYNTTNLYSVSLEGLFGYIPLGVDSRKEATIAAIDAALEYLTNKKK